MSATSQAATWYSELASEEIEIDRYHLVGKNAHPDEMEAIDIPEEVQLTFPIHGLDADVPYKNAKRVIRVLEDGFSIEELMWGMSWVQSDGGMDDDFVPAAKKALKEYAHGE